MSFERLQLGRYQLQQKVGSGGMGEVYLAEDSRISRQVAIKVERNEPASPYPDTESARIAAQSFEREMRIISQLDHPYILPLYDYGEADVNGTKTTYMVMPYRPEGSLLTWLRQRQSSEPLAPQDVATFIEHGASALQHAHERQVIHQDIKPSNFLIRVRSEEPEHPDLLLTDFGISRTPSATSSTSQMIQGTPTYMAPEQWQGHATYASDQYALAVMAYELLVGRPPFVGKPGQVMYQHLTTTPPLPSSLNPKLSVVIDAVLLRALAKDPAERFASVSAFASALQQAISGKLFPTNGDMAGEGSHASTALESDTREVKREAMLAYDLNTSATPETPTVQPDGIKFPRIAPTPIPTVVSKMPAPTELLGMSGQNRMGEPSAFSSNAPSRGPGVLGPPSMFSVTGTASRLSMFRSNFSAVRILLIVLVLVIGVGGTLFYYGVVTPKGETNNIAPSQQSGIGPSQERDKTTAIVQGNVKATTPPMSTQRQATAQAQATTQTNANVNAQATVQAQGTAQANANEQATVQAQANTRATATAVVKVSTTPLYRLVSAKTGDHFYTTSASERDKAIAQSGYQSESIAAYVFNSKIANTVPLYRLYSAKQGDHFYTTSAQERDKAVAQDGYTYEWIACYAYSTQVGNSKPFYRLYSSKFGDHFYTTSAQERDKAVAQDSYTYEWIAAYVLPG